MLLHEGEDVAAVYTRRDDPREVIWFESVGALAEKLKSLFARHPDHRDDVAYSEIVEVAAAEFHGEGYEGMPSRKPSIANARRLLGREPKTDLDEALERTLEANLQRSAPALVPTR